MGRFTEIPQDTFEALQLDAGVLVKNFDPENPMLANEDIITATKGGINVSCVPTFSDLGEDVDNVPVNMKELKHLDSWEAKMSTTAFGTSPRLIKLALGCADIESDKVIIPRADLKQSDFTDIWWIGDKANEGFVAVQLMNALSTGGFSLQTTKNGKGEFSLEITGHVSIKKQKEVPMKFYSADPDVFSRVELEAEAGTTVVFGTNTSDLQSDVTIDGAYIKGTLKYYDDAESALVTDWGAGNFLVLKFTNLDENATSVKVGLDPSQSSGLVEIINDPDKNGVFKVTNKDGQKFVIEAKNGTETKRQVFDLSALSFVK
jgi:hypothetical protein